jgi:hypothetical protein
MMENNGQSEVKAVSLQKVEANRRNALKSTGPKTDQGKRAVRFNAVKHGFFAKQILLSNLEDDPEEFEGLLKQLREDLQPVGQLEELLVERIALCFWKSRRALRCEIAEAKQNSSEAVEEMKKKGKDPYVAEEAIESAKRAREEAERELTGEEKEARLRDIDERTRNLEEDRRKLRDALEVRANSLTLPREKDLDRILRYETANERQLNRALDRLERLQRMRKGDYVPAPLSVSLEGPLNGNSEN